MLQVLATGISVLALCSVAVAGAVSPRVNGAWAGEMRQIEVSAETSYPMTLRVFGKTAVSDYPTLNCSGKWTKIADKGGYSIYEEKVTNRKDATCIDGIVMVKLDRGHMILGWFAAYAGAPTLAAATLGPAAN